MYTLPPVSGILGVPHCSAGAQRFHWGIWYHGSNFVQRSDVARKIKPAHHSLFREKNDGDSFDTEY